MPSFFMRLKRVEGLIPSAAAAPFDPFTRHRLRSSARRMVSRSVSASVAGGGATLAVSSSSVGIFSVSPPVRMAARSITFRSSRTLPGQGWRWSASIVRRGTWVILLPMRRQAPSRKTQTRAGMSSARSRSGGTRIGKTLRR